MKLTWRLENPARKREIELAHAARGAPLAQEAPERTSMLFMSGR